MFESDEKFLVKMKPGLSVVATSFYNHLYNVEHENRPNCEYLSSETLRNIVVKEYGMEELEDDFIPVNYQQFSSRKCEQVRGKRNNCSVG